MCHYKEILLCGEFFHCSDIVISQCHYKMSLHGNIIMYSEFFPCSHIEISRSHYKMSLQGNIIHRECFPCSDIEQNVTTTFSYTYFIMVSD